MIKNLLNNEKGFSIAEIMIAMLIMSIGLLALAQVQTDSMRSNLLARQRTNSMLVAQTYIEEVLNMDYDDINTNTIIKTIDNINYNIAISVSKDPTFEIKNITVNVKGDGQTVRFETISIKGI